MTNRPRFAAFAAAAFLLTATAAAAMTPGQNSVAANGATVLPGVSSAAAPCGSTSDNRSPLGY